MPFQFSFFNFCFILFISPLFVLGWLDCKYYFTLVIFFIIDNYSRNKERNNFDKIMDSKPKTISEYKK